MRVTSLFSAALMLSVALVAASPAPAKVGSKPPKGVKHPVASLPSKKPPPGPIHHPLPPSNNAAAVCGHAKTCDACHALRPKEGKCGFALGTAKCIPIVAHGPSVAANAAQCKALAGQLSQTQDKKDDAVRATNAGKLWNKISAHVFTGPAGKKTSGRHLASAWIKANTNKGEKSEPATSLASFPFGQNGGKTKTVWVDTAAHGHYTEALVKRMCVDAITASMIANRKSTTTPLKGAHAFAVKSFPGGPNVCVEYSGASCYPASIEATHAALGHACTGQAGVEDE